MTSIFQMESKIREIIDELKGLSSQNGLSNQAEEERVITTVFLYKFLNDKYIYSLNQFAEDIGVTIDEMLANENNELDAFYIENSGSVEFRQEDTIQHLVNLTNRSDFYKLFDETLVRISNYDNNIKFGIELDDKSRQPLFEPITTVVQSNARNNFAANIFAIIGKDKFAFGEAFDKSFDFYSSIFEYLIKDYNVASGTYAEYFTPQSVSDIMAKILVGMTETKGPAEIYDPSAGSGSLILHLAHELGQERGTNRAHVFSQDISNKSTRFLRLNLMLNGMTESLSNVIEGDTLLRPSHYAVEHDPTSGLKKFDYITSNPPFKMDFSSTRDQIEGAWAETNRFAQGIPNIPKKDKAGMEIYLMFIQHIMYSLKDEGKAAIVVPTGFITAKTGIANKVKKELIDKKMLKGVVSMPSNIFANTGTNVSILFIDKANTTDGVILIDATNLGKKVKDGGNQRTVLSNEENNLIIDTFVNKEDVEDFSVIVTYDEILEKGESLSAGQYFPIKIDYIDISEEEFDKQLSYYIEKNENLFFRSHELSLEILGKLKELNYEEKNN